MKRTITNIRTLKSTPLVTHNKTTYLSFLNIPWPGEQSVVPQKLQTR